MQAEPYQISSHSWMIGIRSKLNNGQQQCLLFPPGTLSCLLG
jgi:hypothetical protein